ncbi:hypothetical protein B5F12_00395 [Pseudoflavonifractor sp. An176]|uniref:glycosyltransferase family 8 protein n=1 Tax=Pseudoflavonifractor sp. An176 TaxID=1965572 RepID=UPI000B39D14D|nr:glycosyltransferase family 8 protein [Pseudoflavonifractor sp. An176]OUP66020.1 hypothetical protein B5F12_00395 [Pseudoflavonifractor sp. An176]
MNILISVDQRYVEKAKTTLFSLRLHTKEEITVYLINHSLSDESTRELGEYLKNKCDIQLYVIDAKKTALDNFPIPNSNFSIETYYRILAQFMLPDSVDRVLWLDVDIIVQKDLSEFYWQDFEGKKLIVCCDRQNMTELVFERKEALGLEKDYQYFNAGVLLINLTLLREGLSLEDLVKECEKYIDVLFWGDQDLLNLLYGDSTKIVDWEKYNFQINGDRHVSEEAVLKAYILHYTTGRKPWNYKYLCSSSKYYWRIRLKQGEGFELLYLIPMSIIYQSVYYSMRLVYHQLKKLKGRPRS